MQGKGGKGALGKKGGRHNPFKIEKSRKKKNSSSRGKGKKYLPGQPRGGQKRGKGKGGVKIVR